MIVNDVAPRDKSKAGRIIGLSIGAMAILLLFSLLGLFMYRRTKKGLSDDSSSEIPDVSEETEIGTVLTETTKTTLDIQTDPELFTSDTPPENREDNTMNEVFF